MQYLRLCHSHIFRLTRYQESKQFLFLYIVFDKFYGQNYCVVLLFSLQLSRQSVCNLHMKFVYQIFFINAIVLRIEEHRRLQLLQVLMHILIDVEIKMRLFVSTVSAKF